MAQASVKAEAEARISHLTRELETQKRDFAEKMRQFAEVTEALEKRVGDTSKGEKKRAANELAEVVRKHNAKVRSSRGATLARLDDSGECPRTLSRRTPGVSAHGGGRRWPPH